MKLIGHKKAKLMCGSPRVFSPKDIFLVFFIGYFTEDIRFTETPQPSGGPMQITDDIIEELEEAILATTLSAPSAPPKSSKSTGLMLHSYKLSWQNLFDRDYNPFSW